MFAVPALLVLVHTAFAATAPHAAILPRQSTIAGSSGSCGSSCGSYGNEVTSAGSNVAALCTNTIAQTAATCYDCLVGGGFDTQASAQELMDDYIDSCSAAGFNLNKITITGPSSGSSGGSTGAGTTSGSSGSQTGNTNTGSSGSTGSTGSGIGGGGGNGLKTSGASSRLRLSAGYVAGGVVAASTLSILFIGII